MGGGRKGRNLAREEIARTESNRIELNIASGRCVQMDDRWRCSAFEWVGSCFAFSTRNGRVRRQRGEGVKRERRWKEGGGEIELVNEWGMQASKVFMNGWIVCVICK